MKTTTPHTLEDRLMMEQHLTVELVEEIRELEKEIEELKQDEIVFYPISGMIEGEEAKDIEVRVIQHLVVATGKTVEDDSFIYTVIDLKTGNMGLWNATKPGQKPCITVWQEDMEHATLFSTQLAVDFPTNSIAKDIYKPLNKQLHKYCYVYQ